MNEKLLREIRNWIDGHFDEMLCDLEALVRIPSVARYDAKDTPFGADCLNALNFMRKRAEDFGLQSRSVFDMCAEISGAFSDSEIALWNHLDVVPAGEGWTYTAPFEPLRLGDYLIGRGADDNKGPAMASLYLLRMFRELGIRTRHSIKLCLGTDEEQRMQDVAHYAFAQPEAKLNIVADCGFPVCFGEKGILSAEIVSAEPLKSIRALTGGTGKNIVPDYAEMLIRAEGGREDTRLTAHGTSAHSAYPDGSVNAIGELCRGALSGGLLKGYDRQIAAFLAAVCGDWTGAPLGAVFSDELSGQTTCVGTMVSLDAENRAHLHLNMRYSISARAEELLASMAKACAAQGCTLENAEDSAPNYYPPETPVVGALTRVFNEMTGRDAKPYVMSGGTYARKLPNAIGFGLGGLGKPATDLFKPGHGAFHQPDEALYIPNLKKAMPILAMGLLEADRVIE